LLRVLTDEGLREEQLVVAFFRHGDFAGPDDYLATVETVWGFASAWELLRKLRGVEAGIVLSGALKDNVPHAVNAWPFLLGIPEPDFLTCIEIGLKMVRDPQRRLMVPDAINRVCQRRGVPYRLEAFPNEYFVWTGDAIVNEQVLRPALSALEDARLANGARQEFKTARDELRQGTPGSRKQAVAEACNAVESALKVLLTEHGVALPENQSLDALVRACKDAGLFPPAVDGRSVPIEQILVGPGRFGNRRGRHGGGAVPHDVAPEEAEAVVSAAAVAMTFIAKRLP
jgi:hypothetical protein